MIVIAGGAANCLPLCGVTSVKHLCAARPRWCAHVLARGGARPAARAVCSMRSQILHHVRALEPVAELAVVAANSNPGDVGDPAVPSPPADSLGLLKAVKRQ